MDAIDGWYDSLVTHLFGCVPEKDIEISLNNSKLIVRLHMRPHPLWQLLQGIRVAKPGWNGICLFSVTRGCGLGYDLSSQSMIAP